MPRPLHLAALLAAAATAAVPATLAVAADAPAPAEPSARTAAAKTVTLRGVAFSPKTVRIRKGDTVRFAFRDNGVTHNVRPVGSRTFKVVVNGRTRASIPDRTSGTFSTTKFRRAGTYSYICSIHATPDDDGRFPAGSMTGKIVVR